MNSKLKILSEFRKKDKRGNSEIWANCLCECGNKKDIRRKDVLIGNAIDNADWLRGGVVWQPYA